MWSEESKTFQLVREQTGVLEPQNARGRGGFRPLLMSQMGQKLRRGKGSSQGYTARKVRRTRLLVRICIFRYFFCDRVEDEHK